MDVLNERRVVVGVDCTPASVTLLRWADRQAELIGATLVAVTGWRIELPEFDLASTVIEVEARTRQVLAEAIRSALPPARARAARLRVLDTAPADALIAESTEADLVVVGPRSANAIQGLLLGSVTENVTTGFWPGAVLATLTMLNLYLPITASCRSRRPVCTLSMGAMPEVKAWHWAHSPSSVLGPPVWSVKPAGAVVAKLTRSWQEAQATMPGLFLQLLPGSDAFASLLKVWHALQLLGSEVPLEVICGKATSLKFTPWKVKGTPAATLGRCSPMCTLCSTRLKSTVPL